VWDVPRVLKTDASHSVNSRPGQPFIGRSVPS
jgi:hypothetical protein